MSSLRRHFLPWHVPLPASLRQELLVLRLLLRFLLVFQLRSTVLLELVQVVKTIESGSNARRNEGDCNLRVHLYRERKSG